MWERKGFPVVEIENLTTEKNKRVCPVLGLTYRLPLFSAGIRGQKGSRREDEHHTRGRNPGGEASGSGGPIRVEAVAIGEKAASSSDESTTSSSSSSRRHKRRRHKKSKKTTKRSKKTLTDKELKEVEKLDRAKAQKELKESTARRTLASAVGEALAVPALNLQTAMAQPNFHELPQSVQQSALATSRKLDEVSLAAAKVTMGDPNVDMGVSNMKEVKGLVAEAKRKTDITMQMMHTISTMRSGQ